MPHQRLTPTAYLRDNTLVLKHQEVRMAIGIGPADFQKKVRRAAARSPALRSYMPGIPKKIPADRSLEDPRYYDIAWIEEALDMVFFRTAPGSSGGKARLKAVFAAAKADPALVQPWPERDAPQEASAAAPDKPEEMAEGEAISPEPRQAVAPDDMPEPDEDEIVVPPQAPAVYNKDQETLTTSLLVAKAYGKSHFNVLRDIERILKLHSDLSSAFLFRKTEYVGKDNTKRPMYEMNQDAFVLLVGGWSVELRVAYITEFNRMKASLKEQASQTGEIATLVGRVDSLAANMSTLTANMTGMTVTVGGLVEQMSGLINAVNTAQGAPRQPQPTYDARRRGEYSILRIAKDYHFPDRELRNVWLAGKIVYNEIDGLWQATDTGFESGMVVNRPLVLYGAEVPGKVHAVLTKVGAEQIRKKLLELARFRKGKDDDVRQPDLYADNGESDPNPHDA